MKVQEVVQDNEDLVTPKNFRQIRYYNLDDVPLSRHTDQELAARAFHVMDIYRTFRGPLRALGKIEIRGILRALEERKAYKQARLVLQTASRRKML